MIVNGRMLKPGVVLDYDLCIIGSGPAGITLALELAQTRKRICVLEAGDESVGKVGLEEFFSGDNVGLDYKLTECRSRRLGGTSDIWAGYVAMLDPNDFVEKAGLPRSGWPISYDSLRPYYERAYKLLGGTSCEFDPEKLSRPQYERIRFAFDEITSKIWHFNPLNFAKQFSRILKKSEIIDVYINSTVIRIVPGPCGDRISHLVVASGVNRFFTVRARLFVLACGALENARFLLAQRRVVPDVFRNRHIGLYFMEHPAYMKCAHVLLSGPHANSKLYHMPDPKQFLREIPVCAFFQIGSPLRDKLRLPNAAFNLNRPIIPIQLRERVSLTLRNLYGREEQAERLARILVISEQYPNASSRVTLSDANDPFGIPKIRLDWQLADEEVKKILLSLRTLGMKLGQNGLGRLQFSEWVLGEKAIEHVHYSWHQMGTTRMARTADDGVVDTNCRMFGLENAYIAGSSVFPTSGCANPTFTILALTIRLADHLKTNKEMA
ncbi:MAG: GMC family oxidoreductase [Candidatus Aminicenantes bacterium]|nr:GMC family oxidoreductase [Candidatus Aminicenantes bacterium]